MSGGLKKHIVSMSARLGETLVLRHRVVSVLSKRRTRFSPICSSKRGAPAVV